MRIALILGVAALALAQPAFDVASLKPNHSGTRYSSGAALRSGNLRATNNTMRSLLHVAFGISELQITGPDWIDSDRFDITAKSPQGVPDTELKPLIQALLESRFHLTTHYESKEQPVYELVIAKGGLKLAVFDDAHPPAPPKPTGAYTDFAGRITMPELADAITTFAGRTVLDKTGLTGRYACFLSFSPLSGDTSATDIFTALQQQAGLKLEPKKESVQTLIIDHADRTPTEN